MLRAGRHHPQIVYVQRGDEPADDDVMFAVCMDEYKAAALIERANKPAPQPSVEFWTRKLATLTRIVAEGLDSPFRVIREHSVHLRVERDHLAALLTAVGVEVEDAADE